MVELFKNSKLSFNHIQTYVHMREAHKSHFLSKIAKKVVINFMND
jgi:hypothetical protein